VLASTGILIGVGELMPKAHAVARPAGWLRIGAPLLRALQVLLLPVAAPLAALSRRLLREPTPEETALTYDELRHAIEIAEEDDSPAEEKRILRGLVDLGTLAVRDVMLPVERVVALRAGLAQAEVHRIITQEGFSRFPVLGAGWQDVRGVLYAKDLIPTLGQPNPRPWPELLRPAYYVHEGQRINKLLQEFRTQRLHLALVRDNRGQVVGLITLQDILDEIFGEMKDEFDSPAEYAPLAPQEWRLDGRLPYLHLAQMATLAPDVWPGPPQTPVSQVVQALAGGGALRRGQRISGPGYTFEVLATDATGRATQLRFVLQ
jgi:CBS domain containing-hemolysin-like protein